MTEAHLNEIAARADAATQGPWGAYGIEVWRGGEVVAWVNKSGATGLNPPSMDVAKANASFFAHARDDVPALVAEVRKLRALLGEFAWRRGTLVTSCIKCNATERYGHEADCPIGEALK